MCQSARDSGGEDSGASLKISKEIFSVIARQFVELLQLWLRSGTGTLISTIPGRPVERTHAGFHRFYCNQRADQECQLGLTVQAEVLVLPAPLSSRAQVGSGRQELNERAFH